MRRHFILPLILIASAAALGKSPPAAHHHAVGLRSPVSNRLRTLAARAKSRRGWRALGRFAASTRVRRERALAYFVLGYHEYVAGQDGLAADHLRISAAKPSALEDFAAFYEAKAEARSSRTMDALDVLQGFASRYPESVFKSPANELRASLLINTGNPQQALQILKAAPAGMIKATSLLLVAQADEALHNDTAAARAYLAVYNGFPTSPESRTAAAAISRLRLRMGSGFPEPSLEAQTQRASRIFEKGLYQEALTSYDRLLRSNPRAELSGEWRLARARCFIRMRQYSEAMSALALPEQGNAETDAQRLALKAEVCELNGDESSLIKMLDEIYSKYPLSPSYGDALAFTGGYFARQGLWQTANQYYQTLSRAFPKNRYAVEASWRAAWYDVLSEDWQVAEAALIDFLRRYPQSSRAQAALFWLAKVERRKGDTSRALEIDRVLAARYANTYYGLKASEKVAKERRERRSEVGAGTGGAFLLDQGIQIPRRPPSPVSSCGEGYSDHLLTPYLTLNSLSLDALGAGYLTDVVQLHPKDACLTISVARLRSASHDDASAILDARRAVPDYDEYPFAALPENLWKILYPSPYWNFVQRCARVNRLNPYLVMGLIRQESAFNPHATSATHARGLMQMEPYTATAGVRGWRRRRRVVRALYSPAFNIRISCRYLRHLLASFNGNIPETLASYNAGDDRVRLWITNSKIQDPDKFLETIPFIDTRAYVEEILRDSIIYQQILSGRARFIRRVGNRRD